MNDESFNVFSTTQENPLLAFSDEELREELKRRAQERRKSQKNEIKYIDFEATVIGIDNTQGYKANGDTKYKPFVFWKYRVNNCSYEFAERNNHIDEFYLKQGCFNRYNAPKIGDRVRLRYRRTKGYEIFNLSKAKIIEIIKKEIIANGM